MHLINTYCRPLYQYLIFPEITPQEIYFVQWLFQLGYQVIQFFFCVFIILQKAVFPLSILWFRINQLYSEGESFEIIPYIPKSLSL